MFVRRVLVSTLLGACSYVVAIGLTTLFLLATFDAYDQFDAMHARHPIQIALAILEVAGFAIVALATVVALPLLVGRRLHANVLAAVFVGGLLVGMSGHAYMVGLSSWNKCSLNASIPYGVADYCE